ncbi:MAG TPA: hypothetical protein VL132_11750 [Planctomycetaceae bacterium]|nr:hypothetical protein [Planctomycetaceae bacterium]
MILQHAFLAFRLWLSKVWPPWPYLVGATIALGLIESIHVWQEVQARRFGPVGLPIGQLRDGILVAMAIIYAGYRVAAFHPMLLPDYREWLMRTPWRWPRPLPFGPVHLVPQDLSLLGVMISLQQFGGVFSPHALPLTFLVTYSAGIAVATWRTGACGWAYFVAAVLGIPLVLCARPVESLLAALAVTVIAILAAQVTLARFPWSGPAWVAHGDARSMKEAQERKVTELIGWPWNQMAPVSPRLRIPRFDAICLSLLGGWLFWVAGMLFVEMQLGGNRFANPLNLGFAQFLMSKGIFWTMMVIVIRRIAIYIYGRRPPLTLFGRMFTGRWIIPSYDQILLAPIMVVVLASAGGALVWWPGNPAPLATAGVVEAVLLLVGLTAGPSLEAWRLTASHRVVPDIEMEAQAAGSTHRKEFVQLS